MSLGDAKRAVFSLESPSFGAAGAREGPELWYIRPQLSPRRQKDPALLPSLGRLQTGLMSLGIACILWLAAIMAAGLDASVQAARAERPVAMQLYQVADSRLTNDIGLPPGGQWRLGFEQGRRLESGSDPEFYQMLLAWFQHDILGLLCGLLFFLPLIYLRQSPVYFGYIHRHRLACHHLQFRFCHCDSRPDCR